MERDAERAIKFAVNTFINNSMVGILSDGSIVAAAQTPNGETFVYEFYQSIGSDLDQVARTYEFEYKIGDQKDLIVGPDVVGENRGLRLDPKSFALWRISQRLPQYKSIMRRISRN